MSATDILKNAAGHIADRAKERDTDEERSMRRAVDSFNALTGAELSETDGLLFMVILKMARATAGGYNPDDYEDMAAYAALAGECETIERNKPEPRKLETVDDGNPMNWDERWIAGRISR